MDRAEPRAPSLAPPSAVSLGTGFAPLSGMAKGALASWAEAIVARVLFDEQPSDLDRMLIDDAVVVRDGDHFRIETGGDSWEQLEAEAQHLEGRCDCGELLSFSGSRSRCRTCGRDYRSC